MNEDQFDPMEAPIEPEESAPPAGSAQAGRALEAPAHRRVRPARPGRPALTITIHSWETPIIGLAMLVAGLLLGYFGRPYLDDATGAANDSSGQAVAQNPPASSGAAGAANEDLMEFLVGQTRHFKGSQDAPVTLIEFSDFQ